MKAFAVFACVVSSAVLAANEGEQSENLLKPTNKVESWRFEQHEGGKGEIKAADDAIVFTTTETDGTNWHVQAYQVDLDLKEGQEYVVTFELKAEKPQLVTLSAMIDQEDWHNIGLHEELYATREFRKQESTFTATGVAAKKNRVGFVLGDAKGVVSVRNMTLKPKAKQ